MMRTMRSSLDGAVASLAATDVQLAYSAVTLAAFGPLSPASAS